MGLVSEDHVLSAIARFFPSRVDDPRLLVERADDCAVLRVDKPLCVSTDWFMEEVHFRRKYFSPADIGWKALAVNLSDLAACGAVPVGFSLGLALPGDTPMEFLHGFLTGMAELSELTDTPLTGGDLSKSDRLNICITIFGEAASPLRRGRAKPGDALFLVGQVGLARTGLMRLEAEGASAFKTYPEACAAHLRPFPRLDEGRILHDLALKHPEARIGLMDVSDGLARDLPRLVGLKPSGSASRREKAPGADIALPPPHPEIARYCAANELHADRYRLSGGEDYALVGSCARDALPLVLEALPEACELGKVSEKTGLSCEGQPIEEGFDHFEL